MKKAEVLEKISPLMDYDMRNIEHSPRTRVAVQPDAVILRPGEGRRALVLAPEGVKSMAKYARFPFELAKQLSPDTFSRVATELLERKEIYSVLLKEAKVVAFGKPGINRTLNPTRVLTTIENAIKVEDYNGVMVQENSVILDIVGDRRQPVKRGDLVQAGATVAFSPVGTIAPLVQSYVLRLQCTNGMTTSEVVREFRYGRGGGEGDEIWQFFRESVREAYHSIDRIVENWRNLDQKSIKADDRPMIVEAVLREAGITGEVADAVRAEALRNPPRTEYDVMNLITYASSHLLERPHQIMRARKAAADFASSTEHRKVCPVCHSAR